MSNIEEDIKVLTNIEKLIRIEFKHYLTDREMKAINNVLLEREQDKKRIQELEEERQIVGMPVRNKRSGKIGVILHKWESGSIAVLEKISPRVINTHENMSTLEVITDKVIQEQTIDNVEGGDKNVAKVEEDVKRCNELTKVEHANWIGISNQLAISHILAERKQDKKKIKELEEKYLYEKIAKEEVEELLECSVPKLRIKDMKEKIKLDSIIVGGRRNSKTLEYGVRLGKIKACEELLKESEE